MQGFAVTIRVDFPGLTDLVEYLRTSEQQQRKIDALAAQVQQLTTALSNSTGGLQAAVDTTQET